MAEQGQPRDTRGETASASQIHVQEAGERWTAWRPLRIPMFRNLLFADLVSDIGTFMQGVGAAWLMVSQGAGPLLVALTQTATADYIVWKGWPWLLLGNACRTEPLKPRKSLSDAAVNPRPVARPNARRHRRVE